MCDVSQRTLGKVLEIEHLLPIGMTANGLAERLEVPVRRIQAILDEELSIDNSMARQLADVFHTSTEYWMDLQAAHAREKKASTSNRPVRAPIANDISINVRC